MGLNLPGVGGGFLAAAGAVGGAGKGLADVGEAQTKMNMEAKLQELTQKREEAITRLQGQQQSGLEEQRASHEEARTEKEISGHMGVAQYEAGVKKEEAEKSRTFAGGENEAKRKSQEKIASGHDAARIAAAKAHTPAGKNSPKEWTPRTINLQGSFDPVSHAIVPGRGINVMTHRDGSSWIQAGDKLLPYDASAENGLGVKPESLARAPAGAVQALIANPLGTTPSGVPLKDSFVNRYHYLPLQFMNASNQARDSMNKSSGGGSSGGMGDQPTSPENEDPAETEPDPETAQ